MVINVIGEKVSDNLDNTLGLSLKIERTVGIENTLNVILFVFPN